MIDDLKVITDKPVKYVVNTHFHYDHTDGNQVYAGRADIIAHEYVKYAIEKLDAQSLPATSVSGTDGNSAPGPSFFGGSLIFGARARQDISQ